MTSIKSLSTARVRGRRYGYQMVLRDLDGHDSRFARPRVHDGATLAEARRACWVSQTPVSAEGILEFADWIRAADASLRAFVLAAKNGTTGGAR